MKLPYIQEIQPEWVQRHGTLTCTSTNRSENSQPEIDTHRQIRDLKSCNIYPTSSQRPHFLVCSVAKSCSTLCYPMDCSPPGSSVHGILQARISEWVVISFSRESSWPRDWTCVSCIGRWVLLPLSHQGSPEILYARKKEPETSHRPEILQHIPLKRSESLYTGTFLPNRSEVSKQRK